MCVVPEYEKNTYWLVKEKYVSQPTASNRDPRTDDSFRDLYNMLFASSSGNLREGRRVTVVKNMCNKIAYCTR